MMSLFFIFIYTYIYTPSNQHSKAFSVFKINFETSFLYQLFQISFPTCFWGSPTNEFPLCHSDVCLTHINYNIVHNSKPLWQLKLTIITLKFNFFSKKYFFYYNYLFLNLCIHIYIYIYIYYTLKSTFYSLPYV